jgi:GNAT superfamily N-acetyltransferase
MNSAYENKSLIIRKASFDEMQFLISSSEDEGWNPGVEDATPFYSTDPNGFFVAELNNQKIGCVSAVSYNEHFGFIGFYIVKPEYRGQGIGLKLWQKAIEKLKGRIIGLDSVVEIHNIYKKLGFDIHHKNIRFEGCPTKDCPSSVINLKEISPETIFEYDRAIFGFDRNTFLTKWLQMTNCHSLGVVDKGKLVGYGVIRSCVTGYKIGPLFADSDEIAEKIFLGLCSKVKGAPIFLDVPETNIKAIAIAEKYNMEEVFSTVRMYNKTPMKRLREKVYGVTSFELG